MILLRTKFFLEKDFVYGKIKTIMLSNKYFPCVEVAIFFGFLMALIWLIVPLVDGEVMDYVFIIFLVIFTILSHIWHRTGLQDIGIRTDNFLQASKALAPVVLITAVLILTTGLLLKTLNFGKGFFISLVTYPIWGMVQQYALQSFVNTRLRLVIKNEHLLALVCAALFAIVHLPNRWLMAFTFVAGYFLSFVFCKYPNLLAVGICHGIWGTVLGDSLPYNIIHGMVIGTGYYK